MWRSMTTNEYRTEGVSPVDPMIGLEGPNGWSRIRLKGPLSSSFSQLVFRIPYCQTTRDNVPLSYCYCDGMDAVSAYACRVAYYRNRELNREVSKRSTRNQSKGVLATIVEYSMRKNVKESLFLSANHQQAVKRLSTTYST